MRIVIEKTSGVTDAYGNPLIAVYLEFDDGRKRNRRYFKDIEIARQYAKGLIERMTIVEHD